MNTFARSLQYEKAQNTKTSIEHFRTLLQKHYDPLLYQQDNSFLEGVYGDEQKQLHTSLLPFYPDLHMLKRIECIDISNTMGSFATGSLVVLTNGIADKTQYRRFRIRTIDAPNDFAMIQEVVQRRLKHAEWPNPDLLVIDGGKGQVRSAQRALAQGGVLWPLIGLAKRFEEVVVPVSDDLRIVKLPLDHKGLQLLERIRDESHRFALTYHRLLRKKNFLPSAQSTLV